MPNLMRLGLTGMLGVIPFFFCDFMIEGIYLGRMPGIVCAILIVIAAVSLFAIIGGFLIQLWDDQ